MSNIAEKISKNKFGVIMATAISALFLYINYSRFNQQVSSNNKLLVNYRQEVDEMYNYREPKIAVLLYDKKSLETIITPSKSYLPYLYKQYGRPDKVVILDPAYNMEDAFEIANKNRLTPKAVELNSKKLDSYISFYNKEDHKTNIINFVNENQAYLNDIIEKSLNSRNDVFHASKKDYPIALFDKGNSFVYDNKGVEAGSLNANIGIGQDLANNIKKAIDQGLNVNNFNIALLTEVKPISYNSQEELFAKINPKTDGLVLRDGYRQAVMLPYMWDKYKTVEDFVGQLKLKAKILPNYNSNNIKFYKFEVVDI